MASKETLVFVSGAIIACNLIVGLFFWRFWRQTRDRLFRYFAFAFWIFALERVLLVSNTSNVTERSPLVYLFRLAAFLLIIWAILDKNRRRPDSL
jgi:hypothetical protein